MELKILAYDVDDTLIKTSENSVISLFDAAVLFGLNPPPPKILLERFKEYQGLTWAQVVKIIWPNIDIAEFRPFYEKHKPGIIYPAIEGAKEALEELKQRGYVQGIITNRSDSLFSQRMEEAGYDLCFFDFYYTRDMIGTTKEKPGFFNVLLEECARRGLEKEHAVYIGDTLLDLRATRDAGIYFIAVLTGQASKEDFVREGLSPQQVMPSVKGLPGLLGRL